MQKHTSIKYSILCALLKIVVRFFLQKHPSSTLGIMYERQTIEMKLYSIIHTPTLTTGNEAKLSAIQ